MEGFLSRFGVRKKGNTGVLYVRGNEVEFLFFRKEQKEIKIVLYGAEQAPTWDLQATLHKVLGFAEKEGKINELIVTFPPDQFRAHMIEEQVAPTNAKHIISAREARILEKEMRNRIERTLHQRLFQDTGILPNDFALRKISMVERAIDGYRVPQLQGYKRGEITFALLGVFLLEPPFLAVENIAKRHNIAPIHCLHMAEAIWKFAKTAQKPGVYVVLDQEYTQLALWKDQRFRFCGLIRKGADDFVRIVQNEFGLQENAAKEFLLQYAKGNLSQEAQARTLAVLLPDLRNFATLVKKKLAQTGLSLPPQFWVFGKTAWLDDMNTVFGESIEEELAFLAKPNFAALLPEHIWENANFSEKANPAYTPLCMLGAASLRTIS